MISVAPAKDEVRLEWVRQAICLWLVEHSAKIEWNTPISQAINGKFFLKKGPFFCPLLRPVRVAGMLVYVTDYIVYTAHAKGKHGLIRPFSGAAWRIVTILYHAGLLCWNSRVYTFRMKARNFV